VVGFVGVRNIDVEEGRHRLADASAVADQDDRVSDPDFRWRSGAHFAFGTEDVFQESGQAGEVARDNSRYDGRPADGLVLGHAPNFDDDASLIKTTTIAPSVGRISEA